MSLSPLLFVALPVPAAVLCLAHRVVGRSSRKAKSRSIVMTGHSALSIWTKATVR